MKKVITYGTFDLFHRGHYNILKRAKELGDYLIVGVTSEGYDIERGKLNVKDSLTTRIKNVMNTGFVDQVIIEEYLGQKIRDIDKYNVDVFVIGSDWIGKFDHLKKYCEVVYLERTKDISSTKLRKETGSILNLGVVIDNESEEDNQQPDSIIEDVKYVSGYHCIGAYGEDYNNTVRFCDSRQLDKAFKTYDEMLEDVDLVCIKRPCAADLIRRALKAGKHVVSNSPVAVSEAECRELFELAKEKGVAFIENITTVYLRAFTQLLWMAQGDVIGNTLAVKCSVSVDDAGSKYGNLPWLATCIGMIIKILGGNYSSINKNIISTEAEEGEVQAEGITDGNNNKASSVRYEKLTFNYDNALGTAEVASGIEMKNHMTIIGDKATITVNDDWWNTGYFEVKNKDSKFTKKCSFNFEGSGFRYVLQELLIMIREGHISSSRLFPEESIEIAKVIEKIEIKDL